MYYYTLYYNVYAVWYVPHVSNKYILYAVKSIKLH